MLVWALAGHGIMLKSRADVAGDIAARCLEQVLPGWQSAPAPVYALLPSARHVSLKARAFLTGLAERLAGCGIH